MEMDSYRLNWLIFVTLALSAVPCSVGQKYISALGDPGMARDGLRVAFEGWNFCNEVGAEAPNMGSPRAADCFDIYPVGQFRICFVISSTSSSTSLRVISWSKQFN